MEYPENNEASFWVDLFDTLNLLFHLFCRENRVPWGFTLANNLVFKKVRATLGLDRCKLCLTGAAPITKETLEYFMSLNIPVMELYGMSESSGPHTVSIDEYRIARYACVVLMDGNMDKVHFG